MKFFKQRSKTAIRLSVEARWDFEVRDEAGFLAHVRGRLAAERGDHPERVAEHTQDVEQALLALFELDDWSTDYRKYGLAYAGSGFQILPTNEALLDMNADPRVAARNLSTGLSVEARWDFEVRNEESFLVYVRRRLETERGYRTDEATELAKDVEQALLALFELDGWSADYNDSGLEDAGRSCHVERTGKTLFEMDSDERMDSGF